MWLVKDLDRYSIDFATKPKDCDELQWNLALRKPDLRKNLDLRKIVATTDFLVHKLFDLRKIF